MVMEKTSQEKTPQEAHIFKKNCHQQSMGEADANIYNLNKCKWTNMLYLKGRLSYRVEIKRLNVYKYTLIKNLTQKVNWIDNGCN